ncbi:preprotein translocase subunit SecA [Exiguobacterium artemiae]|uniref:preprotein translocase subunit SecA n=1 Tax=Exiguobacterium artemiae TaxID=340145 RepID=UPI002963D71E|nr:preprotein translocase subunit SecA [Exiguobacterium sibiricum]MDW2884418.1 preprotein translocase subunit SecA [Exiguobacterium sibiricum]
MFQRVKQLIDEQSRRMRRYEKTVLLINSLEAEMEQKTDEELQLLTTSLKSRLQAGEKIEAITVTAFALVREASKRTLGLRHYDVQLIGGLALLSGHIAEMATGEGKTLVASLASFTQALHGQGVHVITVNEYLAQRDAEQIGQIHRFLGLTVGINSAELSFEEKQQAYAADITYGVGTEFGFDYLRDHLVMRQEDRLQRPLCFALIDEVDSVLIDEAKTPLIMAERDTVHEGLQQLVRHVVKDFTEDADYTFDEEIKAVALTDQGIETIERTFGIDQLFAAEHAVLFHYVIQALRAHVVLQRDVDYIVKDDKIALVDLFTGRLMEGRSLSDGLHQALEAKEHVSVTEENRTTAQITIQHYFRLYHHVCGMTGTAATSRDEFLKTYRMDVVSIPPNRPKIRIDEADVLFLTSPEKYSAIAAATETAHATGQPVLIGTTSIEQSLKVADVLDQRHIPYEILNAKTVDQEIRIIESAGRHGRVTIATNMAGRGTDILLDDAAKAQGGLFVIGTERHESVRIDNQLRGRAGRQGDPGLTRFYLSLEDELPRRFARERLERVKKKLGPVTGPISAKEAQQLMAYAQETCESVNRSVRDDLVQLEEVISEQRLAIYRLRNQIVDSTTLDQFVQPFAARTVHAYLDQYLTDDLVPEEWPIELLTTELEQLLHQPVELPLADSIETIKQQLEPLIAAVDQRMALQITEDEETARRFMLLALDEQWTSHLTAMNSLKEGIHLRSYGQEQPVRIFEREGMDYFRYAIFSFEKQVVSGLCRLEETTLQGGLLHATVD